MRTETKSAVMGATLGLTVAVGAIALQLSALEPGPQRLSVYIDPDNGCQYLGRAGAIIPRTDSQGKQLGCRDPNSNQGSSE